MEHPNDDGFVHRRLDIIEEACGTISSGESYASVKSTVMNEIATLRSTVLQKGFYLSLSAEAVSRLLSLLHRWRRLSLPARSTQYYENIGHLRKDIYHRYRGVLLPPQERLKRF